MTSIRTVFIANRGEIAARIERTCHRLGIRAFTPATDGSDGLDLLDPDAVVAAAIAAGSDALHPGFGFLSENAAFATAVERAGIRWIGPPAVAIRTMGDKAAARRLAKKLGVPVLPGWDGGDQSEAALVEAADRIGLPVLVKPAAGGGGKGIRVVRDTADLGDTLAAARREARQAFGDERLILERYLEGPRHVEVQVLFDRHGEGVHLGERDCSIQRRHQKVLEETPSGAVDEALRDALATAALRLAAAVGYTSAGTCEFLLDDAGAFWFLEMNTRLQVEHPVTEAVTGRDLVADQIRIAAGEPLGVSQQEIVADGHAVEVRLYAEDPEAGFLPSTGRVEAVRWPAGDGIRVDAGIEAGTVVGSRFDPLLAKIVAHGGDRREAFARLTTALDRTVVLGLVTNLGFLRWLVRQPVVLGGEARIDSLDAIWPAAGGPRPIPGEAWRTAAMVLLAEHREGVWSGGWRLTGPPILRLATDGEERTVAVEPSDADGPATVMADDTVHVDVGGRSVAFRLAPAPDVERAAAAAATHRSGRVAESDLVAPMPGTVIAVHVRLGDRVAAGDRIVTLEAMKMEHVVNAPADGRVTAMAVRPGDRVARGRPLASVTVSG